MAYKRVLPNRWEVSASDGIELMYTDAPPWAWSVKDTQTGFQASGTLPSTRRSVHYQSEVLRMMRAAEVDAQIYRGINPPARATVEQLFKWATNLNSVLVITLKSGCRRLSVKVKGVKYVWDRSSGTVCDLDGEFILRTRVEPIFHGHAIDGFDETHEEDK